METIETTTTAPAATGRTIWTIDPSHTIAEFGVKHLMISTVRGRFTGVSGTIAIDDADPTRSTIDVAIDAATVNTHDDGRDNHLRSADFLDVENHPKITFRGTRIERAGKDHFRVSGELTIRGVTRPITLDAELQGTNTTPWGTRVIGFTATGKVNRKDYGLNWNAALEAGGFVVGDDVKLTIDLEAIKQD